jgi:hypothetical protein
MSRPAIISPVSSPATEIENAPQQSVRPADEDLEIEETPGANTPADHPNTAGASASADAILPSLIVTDTTTTVPRPTPSQGGQQARQPNAYVKTPVSGFIYLKDDAGTVIPRGGGQLNGVALSLVDADYKVVAQTTANPEGYFVFEPVGLRYVTEYILLATLPESGGLAATPENPKGQVLLTLEPGKGTDSAAIYVTYTHAPSGAVTLYGGDCACGHVNPGRAVISGGSSVRWEIVRERDGSVVARGTSSVITTELQNLRNSGADGFYTIVSTIADQVGNEEVRKVSIQIYSGTIRPNQFA